MKKSFLYLTIVLLFGIALWQNNAQAQCRYLQPNGVTIVPDVTTLEITGGNLFDGQTPAPGSDTPPTTHDVFIRLDSGNPGSLGVTIINQETLEVEFADITVISFAFGFSDHIINTEDGGLGTAIITNGGLGGGTLTYLYSPDGGTTWDQAPVGTPKLYSNAGIVNTCENQLFCNDSAILGYNVASGGIDAYWTDDGGHTWNGGDQVVDPPVVPPFNGGVVPCYSPNVGGGYTGVYSIPINATEMEVVIGNTSTGFTQVVDTDTYNDGVLRDFSCAQNGPFSIAGGYNRQKDVYTLYSWDTSFGQPGGNPAVVEDLGPAGNFNAPPQQGFTSVSTSRTPSKKDQEWLFGLFAPDGNTNNIGLTYNPDGISFRVDIVQSPPRQDPTRLTQGGPISSAQRNKIELIREFIFPEEFGNTVAFNQPGNSFVYAQCVFLEETPIPTLSQWGLIAMAGILGIVGYLVMRRKKVSA